MAWDVTEMAGVARRLDVSATLRAFVLPALTLGVIGTSLAAAVMTLNEPYSNKDTAVYLLLLALLGLIVLPLASVFGDALARQPLAPVSGALALISGALLYTYLAAGFVYASGYGLALAADAEARQWMLEEAGYLANDPAGLAGNALLAAGVLLSGWLLWRTASVETALATAPSRALLLGDVGGAGIGPRFAYLLGLPSSLWRASAMATLAFWLFIVARLLVYASVLPATILAQSLGDDLGEPALAALMIAAAAGLFVGGHLVFLAAKRLAARRIWKEEEANGAGPILFLRSFTDDQFRFEKSWRDPVGRWLELWSFRRNADEVLIDEFAWYGPVIALGQPGERSAPFGAARRYVDHGSWQQVVEDAAARAHVIVMAAGETPGLAWEYELIARRGYLAKTVFLFPPHTAGHPRVQGALERFNAAFPEAALRAPDEGTLVAAMIEAGTVRPITARRPIAQAYLVALRGFLQSREIVLGRTAGDGPMPLAAVMAGFGGALAGLLAGFVIAAIVMDSR